MRRLFLLSRFENLKRSEARPETAQEKNRLRWALTSDQLITRSFPNDGVLLVKVVVVVAPGLRLRD